MSFINFFDKDTLETYIKASAMFILLYEHFEDLVIETVRDELCSTFIFDGKLCSTADKKTITILERAVKSGREEPIPPKMQLRKAHQEYDNYNKILKIENYKEKRSSKDGQRFIGSLNWLTAQGVFNEQEEKRVVEIKTRRNSVVHEMFKTVYDGLTDVDAQMIVDLMKYHCRINKWTAKRECDIPPDCNQSDAVGLDDMIFNSMIDILFAGKSEEYKKAIRQFGLEPE